MNYALILKKLSANLKATYENTIFDHSGDKGDSREKEVRNYLVKVMPRKYGFEQGEIFDIQEGHSGQVDVIIYDNLFSTVFTDGSSKIIAPVGSTYGIISVKSKMGTGELDDAIRGIKKYDALKRPTPKENTLQITPDFALDFGRNLILNGQIKQQNINCIFAFDTTIATETIKQKIVDAGCIDLLVVPGKICGIGRRRSEYGLQRGGQSMSNFVAEGEESIAMFILLLQIYLSRNRLVKGNIEEQALELLLKNFKII